MEKTLEGLQRELADKYCVVESLLNCGQGSLYRLPKNRILTSVPGIGEDGISLLSVDSIDQLLASVEDEDSIPFWAEVWESAIGLARFFHASYPQGLSGKKVLELGCGIGTVGIAVASMGAVCTMLDFAGDALLFAFVNALRAGLIAELYPVEDTLGPLAARDGSDGVVLVKADIRTVEIIGGFDFVVGSDILYEPNLHRDIVRLLGDNLKPGGKGIFADPGRKWASEFIDLFTPQGWAYDLDEIGVTSDKGNKRIDIISLIKPGA